MGARRPNPKRVKIHRSYSVEEAATVCGVHRNTVREWIRRGLKCIDQHRPALIQGRDLRDFVQFKRTRNKKPCQPGEIYCVSCREPRRPADLRAIYRPLTPSQGNLIGICPSCGSRMFRRVSFGKLDLIRGLLRITMPDAVERIDESAQPFENSAFEPEFQQ